MHAVEERYDTSGSTNSDEFTETLHNLKVSSKCLRAVSTRGEAFMPTEDKHPISQAKTRYWSSRKCVASAPFQANVW